ncbi:MAG: leucine-rich repeat domain-containing protein [Holosporales bacterium]|nr:leucine-rich repeat domain-containing protein [Holosporales bacterium]
MVGKVLTLAMLSASNVFCSQVEYQLNDGKVTETVRGGNVPFIAGRNVVFIDGQAYDVDSIVLLNNSVKGSARYVVIPQNIVKIPGSAFKYCLNLRDVTFGLGSLLESIEDYAFCHCSALETIIIPRGVTSIGERTFQMCAELANVTFEQDSTLDTIGKYAFSLCSSLWNITIPQSVTSLGDGAFNKCNKLTNVTFESGSNLNTIRNFAFCECTSLNNITIPQSVTSLGNGVFCTCFGLSSITFESGSKLDRIGDSAFSSCRALRDITIPDGVTHIGADAFHGCPLEAITIPSSGTSLKGAFRGCNELASVTFAQGSQLHVIDGTFEECYSLSEITIPNSVIHIIGFASRSCPLRSIVIPRGVILLEAAFADCTKLSSVIFEANSELRTIKNSAFCRCTSLETITIPRSVTSLGLRAFRWCTKLANVTFESGSRLGAIEKEAFCGCSSLSSITIPDSVTHIGEDAFLDCSLESISIPRSVISLNGFGECRALSSVTFEEGSALDTIGEGAFWGCSSLSEITIPGSVTCIEESAFCECPLQSINIPRNVTCIGRFAFSKCAPCQVCPGGAIGDRMTVTFAPDSGLQTIGHRAFYKCNLESITIPKSVTLVDAEAFGDCTNLSSVTFDQDSPERRLIIGNNAFINCTSLRTVTIASSSIEIAPDAFQNCPSLESVFFDFETGDRDIATFLLNILGARPECKAHFRNRNYVFDEANGWRQERQSMCEVQ